MIYKYALMLYSFHKSLILISKGSKDHVAAIHLVGWLCLMSHLQRGHLETAPPFTVPCEGREAR